MSAKETVKENDFSMLSFSSVRQYFLFAHLLRIFRFFVV